MYYKKQGIYRIVHNNSQMSYVGSSVDIEQRFKDHAYKLNKKTHHCHNLQRAWNSSSPDKFSFEILEIVSDSRDLTEREQHWLDLCNSISGVYNASINVSRQNSKVTKEQEQTLNMLSSRTNLSDNEELELLKAEKILGAFKFLLSENTGALLFAALGISLLLKFNFLALIFAATIALWIVFVVVIYNLMQNR